MYKCKIAQRQIEKHNYHTINSPKMHRVDLNTKVVAYMLNYNRAVMFRRRK